PPPATAAPAVVPAAALQAVQRPAEGPPPLLARPPAAAFDSGEKAPSWTIPSINWEQFMGAKLFAWLGGLALFLGVAFFVKYSFDNNLVPPELRVAIGFVTGLGLLVGGVVMSRKNYP